MARRLAKNRYLRVFEGFLKQHMRKKRTKAVVLVVDGLAWYKSDEEAKDRRF